MATTVGTKLAFKYQNEMLLGVNVCFTNNRKIPYLIVVNANSPRVSSYIKL